MSKHQKSKLSLPTKDEVRHQLERMLTSPDIRITPQQSALLKYVVNQTLAGKADRIKGYTVATEVFGRRADFDQNIDPIVSIQAARLRRALADYYQGPGKHDRLRIDIPKGSYVPKFRKRAYQSADTSARRQDIDINVKSSWPSVHIKPFENLTGDPELDFWGVGLATEIAHELNRYPDIRVLKISGIDKISQVDPDGIQFKIDGSIRSDSSVIKITVQLTDIRTGQMIWSESYQSAIGTTGIIAAQEEIARQIAVKIAGEHGHIAKMLTSRFTRRPPKKMEAYEAVLRYYEYDLTYTPEAFERALAALEKAVRIDPECGQAWAMRARLYADVYAFDIPGFPAPLATAHESAQNGVRLSPVDQRASTILTFVHLLRSDLPAGRTEAERALTLGPKTFFMLDGIGYLMTLLGEWERGPALIEKAIRLNPFYDNNVHYALWIDCLRQADYEGAHLEARKLNQPALFWDHLAKAATLGLRGDIEEGRRSAAKLLDLKPDFPERGRFLIRNYIKFEAIVDQVIKGLDAVDVKVR